MTPWMIPDHAAPLGIAVFGLILGMRHATDADHVIAITAIVSGERRLSAAARLGGLNRALMMSAGILSLGFGLFLAYRQIWI
jgi:high-affinity nickel-transport protein